MSKIFGKMVKNERYFLDYFSFLICFNSYCFQFMHPVWDATRSNYCDKLILMNFNSCIHEECNLIPEIYGTIEKFQFMRPRGMQYCSFTANIKRCQFQFMHPVWDATILPHYCTGSQYCNFNSCARNGRNFKI